MGQQITILSTSVDGDMAAFDTDRGITGQDGAAFASVEEAAEATGLPGMLAARIFNGDTTIDHVFISSNLVVVRRPGGWDQAALEAVSAVIGEFFVFYDEG